MARIVYSPESINDLEQIGDYIENTLQSFSASLSTLQSIRKSINNLESFPYMGTLFTPNGITRTDYRFLVCGNYLAFYRVEEVDEIYAHIVRIIYGKRDYVSILFGMIIKEELE